MTEKPVVLVAGIGGASLGTEVGKAIARDPTFKVIGADISPTAYGHFSRVFEATYVVDQSAYVASIQELCARERVAAIVPGGERPMSLLSEARQQLEENGVHLAINDAALVAQLSNKAVCFEALKNAGIPVPMTARITKREDLAGMPLPLIVKPARDSGGSAGVFFSQSTEDAWLHVQALLHAGKIPIAQQYLPHDEGEYTIGVLSLPTGDLVGSIALRRLFDSKLSIADRGIDYLISSGYSQGLIEEFPQVRNTAEEISRKLGSVGPLNIQGRLKSGVLYPFEINPRFSATTYLRALAGFNEVVIYLRYVLLGETPQATAINPGWYLRSFEEVYVPKGSVLG